jgi:uncharacterized DUF497 family protein
MKTIKKPFVFQWDKGNKNKNWLKHKVTNKECEEAFFDKNKKIIKDEIHSGREKRFIILGKTKEKTLLFIVFTLRGKKLRIISARKINKKEVRLYEKST